MELTRQSELLDATHRKLSEQIRQRFVDGKLDEAKLNAIQAQMSSSGAEFEDSLAYSRMMDMCEAAYGKDANTALIQATNQTAAELNERTGAVEYDARIAMIGCADYLEQVKGDPEKAAVFARDASSIILEQKYTPEPFLGRDDDIGLTLEMER